MSYFLPSSVKSRLLRFALAKTGFLDTDALDLDKLNFSLGRKTSAEFRDVGLRLEKLTALLQLPPSIRLLAARALLVRVTIAGDLSITAEVDGIEVHASIEEPDPQKQDERHPDSLRTPQHRKTARRIQSPPAHDPGGPLGYDSEEPTLRTARDLAKSFLEFEPEEEKQELVANLSQSRYMEESTTSDASSDELGTGTGLGLPAFLTGIIQGVIDRLKVDIKNVILRCDATLRPKGAHLGDHSASMAVVLSIDTIHVDSVTPFETTSSNSGASVGRRRILIEGINLDLLCEATKSSPSSHPPSTAHAGTRSPDYAQTPSETDAALMSSLDSSNVTLPSVKPGESADFSGYVPTTPPKARTREVPEFHPSSPAVSAGSTATTTRGRFADAEEDDEHFSPAHLNSSEIRAGEDSHSYTSRRSHSSSDQAQPMYASIEQSQILSGSIAEFQSSHGSVSDGLPDDLDLAFAGVETATNAIFTECVNDTAVSHDGHMYSDNSVATSPGSPQISPDLHSHMMQSQFLGSSMSDSTSESMSESMFKSAISHNSSPSPEHQRAPGSFPEDSYIGPLSQSTATVRSVGNDETTRSGERTPTRGSHEPSSLQNSTEKTDADFRARSTSSPLRPDDSLSSEGQPDQARKRLIALDIITVWLPGVAQPVVQKDEVLQSAVLDYSPQNSVSASTLGRDMPGTFSQYADMGASRRLQSSYIADQPTSFEPIADASSTASKLDVDLGTLVIQADRPALHLLHRLTGFVKLDASAGNSKAAPPAQDERPLSIQISLRLKVLHLALLERMPEVSVKSEDTSLSLGHDQHRVLIRLHGRDVTFGLTPQPTVPDITVGIRRLVAGSGTKDFLSFKKSSRPESPDILVKIQRSKVTLQNKPITDVRAWIRQINFDLDLLAIDQSLESFGGLSGIMEMSASALSSTSDPVPTPPSLQRRSVRFEEAHKQPSVSGSSPELKLNITLQGASVALRSYTCCVELQCSTVKCNVRPNYIIATVATARLFEHPIESQDSISRFVIQLKDLKLEYLPAPDNHDLERLLSLITPSKDKYENDDDILLDTLLRQRRKGAVMRVRLASVQADVRSWAFVPDLQSLGDDLSKFSAVTKYLPEDDRPGLLILPRIIDANARLPVNESFGVLEISCRDIQIAHIGLPALVALSIGSVRAGPLGGRDIVHELLRPAEHLPMIMMRMLGGEVEPTAKIKFFNVCVEYSVPIITALVGSGTTLETEKVIEDIAASVVNLSALNTGAPLSSPTSQSETPVQSTKRVALDVLLHDCAVGLKPRNSDAKGTLMLTNTKFTATLPPEDMFSATLELRKASLHIVDREMEVKQANEIAPRPAPASDGRPESHLAALGFVCVSSIMSARAVVSITKDSVEEVSFIDIEVRDELFVLETCADSTQTLIGILDGLSPPALPNEEPQFRTEVETVEDMVASFSGDAYARTSRPATTMFDAESSSPMSELAESAILRGSFGPFDPDFFSDEDHEFSVEDASVESLLEEEDFLEITDAPASRLLGDGALWKDLGEQCLQDVGGHESRLRPYYLNDEQLDKTDSRVLGAPYRFLTPATQFPAATMATSATPFPFQIRVRDVHVIWNLFDGYDWEETRERITHAVEEVEQKLEERKQRRRRSVDPEDEEDSVIGDCLFNSIYIGVPSNRDAADLRRQISQGIDDMASESESYATSGTSRPTQHSATRQRRSVPRRSKLRLARSKYHKIAFELKGMSVDFSIHDPSGEAGADNNGKVQSSVDIRLREFDIFDNVPTSTWRKFLTYHHDEVNMREMMKPMIHIEMLNVRPVADLAATEISLRVSILPLRLHVDQDALDFMTRFFEFKPDSVATAPPADPPFIQRIEVNTVDLCLDYKPKKIDYAGIRSGHTGEFKNLVILDRAKIKLRHAIVYGIKGFDALHPTLSDIWTPDVIRTQLPGVLAGLGPLRSFVNLGAGFRDVVAIPVREYKKDGRLVRSVQKGAFQFAKTTTAELARLGAKIAIGTQTVLSGVEETLGGTHLHVEDDQGGAEQRLVSYYANQPHGVFQGLRSGREQLERDLLTAKDALIAVQGEVLDAGSAAGVAQAVGRHAATIVLRPVIGASRAVGQTLMGVGNQVDRANVRRNEDKYKPC